MLIKTGIRHFLLEQIQLMHPINSKVHDNRFAIHDAFLQNELGYTFLHQITIPIG